MTHTTEPHGRGTGSLESGPSGHGDASPDAVVPEGESIQSILAGARTDDVIELPPGTSTEQVVIATDAPMNLCHEPHSIPPLHRWSSVSPSKYTWGATSSDPEPRKVDTT